MRRSAAIVALATVLLPPSVVLAVPRRDLLRRPQVGEPGISRAEGPSRLLRPEVFDRLSPGGRRLARALNGLPGPASRPASPEGRGPELLAAPATLQNVRVNDPAMDETGRTNSESSVTASGANVVVGFNDASIDVSGYAFSTDGGATFTHRRLPPPPDGYLFGEPVLATGPGGEVYYATLMTVGGGVFSTIGVSKSTDGGRTFGGPVDAVNASTYPEELMDEPWLTVDAGPSSKYRGTVYLTWTYVGPLGETSTIFARSTDGGATFSAPKNLSAFDTAGVHGSAVAVGPSGELYVAWLDGHTSPPAILVRRSSDGGTSFGAASKVASFPGLSMLTGGGGMRATSFPRLAVDGAARLHVAWAAPPAGVPADRSDVFHAVSADGGATFSAARKVNDDATTTTQAVPAIAVTAGGRVAIRWIDRRNDPANDALTDVYMSVSADGGATFGRSFRVNDTSWAYGTVEPGLAAGDHGTYDGLASSGETFLVTWSDERGRNPDVYFARVPADDDPLTPDLSVTPSSPWGVLRGGESAGFDVRTAGTGLSGDAFLLSLSPPGPGVTSSFAPVSVTAGGTSRLTLLASSSVPARTDRLTLTATGSALSRGSVLLATTYPASRSFDLPENLTRTRGFTGGSARLDAEGVVHVLTEDDSDDVAGSSVLYARGTADGTALAAPVRLSAEDGAGYDPALATGPGGRVIAAWAGHAATDTNDRVYVARSTDGGESFATAVPVSPSSQFAARPVVAVDAAGNVLVAWYDVLPSIAVLYTAHSADGGATFSAPVAISDEAVGVVGRPGLAIDSKGTAYLVYTRQYALSGVIVSVARLAVARDGKTFAAPVSLTSAASALSFGPDVAVGPGDSVCVSYYTRVLTTELVYNREVVVARSTDGGATFSAPVNVSRNEGQSWFPSIAVEPGGAITVAWEDDTVRTATDVFLARSTDGGATFSAPVDVSGTPGSSGSTANPLAEAGGSGRVQVSASSSGGLLVSWLDDSAANPDLFAVRVDPKALSNRPPSATIASPSSGVTVEAGVPVAFSGIGSDPDGDLLVASWSFGDGRVATGTVPSPHPYSRPGTYVVTFTATDPFGASASAAATVVVTAATATGPSLLLPVVLETPGVGGSRFASEVTLSSRGPAATEVLLTYTASLGEGSGVARLTLAPGEQRVLPGVIEWLRERNLAIPADGTGQAGTLLATFVEATGPVFAGARTFTADPAGGTGTFGVFYTAVEPSAGPVTVYGLRQDETQRSNLALVNGGNAPVTLRVALYGPAGEPLGVLPDQALGPWGWAQVPQPLAGKAAAGRAAVTRVSGTSPFAAYGVLNDAVTSDGSYLPPLAGDGEGRASRLVPVILDVAGLGARFRTELTLANLSGSTLPLTLSYAAAPGFGSGSGTVSLTLSAGEQRILPDAVSFLRASLPIEADGRDVAGSLLIEGPAGSPASALAAGARTFVPLAPAGSYGLFYAGLTAGESSTDVAWIHGLREDAAQRSNLAVVHRGDAAGPITLRVSYFDGSGRAVGTSVELILAPGEWRQFGRPLAALGVSQGYARVERIAGAAAFVAYGVLNDNVSSDGSYLPMSR